MAETVSLAWATDAGYFLDERAIYETMENLGADGSWVWLVAMEACKFKPYTPLHGDNDKCYKGLKLGADYLANVLCKRHGVMDAKELRKLDKAVDSTRGALDGAITKRIVGGVGTVVVVAASGGLAFYFAPAIAPALAAALSAETAALSGAALTSASLAFLGGGALAAGGAGMAGGTMLIAGGGALLGAVDGLEVSAMTSMALATDASYVLDECAKLVTFCEEVLIKRYSDLASVVEIHGVLNQRIVELEAEIEAIKRGVPPDEAPDNEDDAADEKEEISPRKMIKILNRSHKFLKRSSDRLTKDIKAGKKVPAFPAGSDEVK
ncbi:hypothetical protein [Olsenella sp. Marseille-P4559]|uniref:hypothetical protein n=1 Tax=Olsenella sp. Marseille-P4559 TaxID=2364795 RepID=UPI00102F2EEC|nr:hypothetical protein [Olsenella sp. Marseille-P4559]